MKYLFAAITLVIVLLVGWAVLRPATTVPVMAVPESAAGNGAQVSMGGPMHVPARADDEEVDKSLDDIALDPEAIASLRGAREFGDPRTPPIGRSPPREQATPEELADPEKYVEFEARQERKLKRSYVIEAEKYTQQLRDDIERGKSIGIPPEEIAKVREKVRRIEAMRAQLLAEDPALLDVNSPTPIPKQNSGSLPVIRPEGPLAN